MRYWMYINSKVCGPFEKEKLVEVPGFSLSSLLCPDVPGGAQANDWKAASAYPEVLAALAPAPVPAPPPGPAADSPLLMTMRGTLISEPDVADPAARPPAPAGSPFAMTMRGSLISEPLIEEPAKEQPGKNPGQMSALLASIADNQTLLLDRLTRLESAIADIKARLSPAPPKT